VSGQKTFTQQIHDLQRQVSRLDDNIDETVIEDTAVRLQRLNFTPPIICPVDRFLRMRNQELLTEIDRILTMPDGEACALASDNTEKCEDIRVQFITVLIFYYKKLLELRRGNPEAWDEVDELYVHD
jgi:hypothetical protein